MKLSHLFSPLIAVVLVALTTAPLAAQIASEEQKSTAPQYGEGDAVEFRVGAEITATNGACRDIVAMVAMPLECPEQSVKILGEDVSEGVEISYRDLRGGEAKQMLITVPYLAAGATARAVVTTEVTTRKVLPPESTEGLVIPKRLPMKLRTYVNGSPYIEVKHQRIRALNKEVMEALPEDATDWQKVEAIYDFVLDKIAYVEGPDKGALDTIRDEQADCQGRSMVFIALCRVNKIPARMVWVQGHAFPEFYLEDAEGNGHWYPCESAGVRAFGEMPLTRTILQKGDNFRTPERKKPLRYASDYLVGFPVDGAGRPKAKFIREEALGQSLGESDEVGAASRAAPGEPETPQTDDGEGSPL